MNCLTALAVSRLKEPGAYADGGGLYLQISLSGGRSWIFRYSLNKRRPEMGLGSVATVSLAEARDFALAARKLVQAGIDPIAAREAEIMKAKLEAAKAITFKQAATQYIESHKPGWRSEKHALQWTATLQTYAYPAIGDLAIQAIDVANVMRVLEPIWAKKTETASRVRSRIEAILDWAKARNYRDGDNPARWRGHLENLLPHRAKVQKVVHQPALPYDQIYDFVSELRQREGMSARALEFVILTACRSSEGLGSVWSEIDLAKRLWVIPENRIKAGRDHRVYLSDRAVEILTDMNELRVNPNADGYVFPGGKRGRPLSNTAMMKVVKAMGYDDITVHGFRSSFRDWAAERTNFPTEVAEMALAHVVGNKVEAAYRRGDLFTKRLKLMEAWAIYCLTPTPPSTVVPIGLRSAN
jgi:integrase